MIDSQPVQDVTHLNPNADTGFIDWHNPPFLTTNVTSAFDGEKLVQQTK